MSRLDPSALGYFERRPGSGVWYHPNRSTMSFEPRICENPSCPREGKPFMGSRKMGRGRFCSTRCAGYRPDSGYQAKHKRIYRARGSASEQTCMDCGSRAEDWSQTHGTDGTDPFEHFQPRCTKCHMAYDAETRSEGERHYNARLTDAQVRGIYASVGANAQELGDLHGVSRGTVHAIRNGDSWKSITGGRKGEW